MPLCSPRRSTTGGSNLYLGSARHLRDKWSVDYDFRLPLALLPLYIVGASRRGKTNALMVILDQLLTGRIPFINIDIEGGTHNYLVNALALSPDLDEIAERFLILDFADATAAFLPMNFLAGEVTYSTIQKFVGVLASLHASSFEVGVRMKSIMETVLSLLAAHRLSLAEIAEVVADKDLV